MESPNRGQRPDDVEAIVDAVVQPAHQPPRVRAAGVRSWAFGAAFIAPVLAACGDDDEARQRRRPSRPRRRRPRPRRRPPAPRRPPPARQRRPRARPPRRRARRRRPPARPRPTRRRDFDGTTVNILVVAEGDEKGVQDKVGEIKDRFGIDLEITALAVGPLLEKANQSLNADEGTFDIITVLGFSVSQMVGGDKFELLNAVPRRPGQDAAGLRLRGLPAGPAGVRRLLRRRERQRSAATSSTCSRACTAARSSPSTARTCWRPPASSRRRIRTRWLDGRRGPQQGRRRRQLDDRQVRRRLAVPRRLLDALHRARRRADERVAADARTSRRTSRATQSVGGAAAHDRLHEVRRERRHAVRLHGLGRRASRPARPR